MAPHHQRSATGFLGACLAAATMLSGCEAHTFMFSRSRMRNAASTLQPMASRKTTDIHGQIGGDEEILVKW